jgi:hypothetical protein
MQFLHEQGLEVTQRHCILPILELLHCNNACFAVMPRWAFFNSSRRSIYVEIPSMQLGFRNIFTKHLHYGRDFGHPAIHVESKSSIFFSSQWVNRTSAGIDISPLLPYNSSCKWCQFSLVFGVMTTCAGYELEQYGCSLLRKRHDCWRLLLSAVPTSQQGFSLMHWSTLICR